MQRSFHLHRHQQRWEPVTDVSYLEKKAGSSGKPSATAGKAKTEPAESKKEIEEANDVEKVTEISKEEKLESEDSQKTEADAEGSVSGESDGEEINKAPAIAVPVVKTPVKGISAPATPAKTPMLPAVKAPPASPASSFKKPTEVTKTPPTTPAVPNKVGPQSGSMKPDAKGSSPFVPKSQYKEPREIDRNVEKEDENQDDAAEEPKASPAVTATAKRPDVRKPGPQTAAAKQAPTPVHISAPASDSTETTSPRSPSQGRRVLPQAPPDKSGMDRSGIERFMASKERVKQQQPEDNVTSFHLKHVEPVATEKGVEKVLVPVKRLI